MRLASLVLVAAGLVLATPLHAEIEPGTKAPNFRFDTKWNTPAGVSQLYDYKAMFVLIVSFATYSTLSMDRMADLEKLSTGYREQGFEVCAASSESSNEIKRVMIDAKKYTFGIVCQNIRGTYQHENVPHAWLMDNRGIIVWRGQPMEFKEESLQRLLALNPPTRIVRKLDPLLSEAVKAFNRGEFGRAMLEAEKVNTIAEKKELKEDCAHVLECCNKHVAKYEQQIKDAGNDLVARHKAMDSAAIRFKGCKKGEDWGKAAADLKASKDYEACAELNDLKKQLEEMKPFQARKKLEALAKKYPDTEAGKEAARLAKRYEE